MRANVARSAFENTIGGIPTSSAEPSTFTLALAETGIADLGYLGRSLQPNSAANTGSTAKLRIPFNTEKK